MSTLTKICSSCGQEKPLSAFLQHSGPEGGSYGSICASCRKTHLEKSRLKDKDDDTFSSSGLKIDAKAKVHAADKQKQLSQQNKEEDIEARIDKEESTIMGEEKKQTIAKEERSHREKRSFLDSSQTAKRAPTIEKVWGGEAHIAEEKRIDYSDVQMGQKQKHGVAYWEFVKRGTVFGEFLKRVGSPAAVKEQTPQEAEKSVTEFIDRNWPKKSR